MKQWNKPTLTDLSVEFTLAGGRSYNPDGKYLDLNNQIVGLMEPISG